MTNTEINQKLSKMYQLYTREFLSEYQAIYQDPEKPSRINEFGIIDEKRFDETHRILVVAKETNGWKNEDFDEGILFRSWMEGISQNGVQGHDHIRRHPRMWYNIGRWITLIQNPDFDRDELSKEKGNVIKAIGTVAFTNINKARGKQASKKEYEQLSYTDIVGKVLKEELEIIQPKIVLCCGTYTPFHYHIPNYPGKVITMPHPTARKGSKGMLDDLRRQIVEEKTER